MLTLDQLSASQVRGIDQGGYLWHAYRQACADSLFFMSKCVLSTLPPEENKMTWRLHGALCLFLQEINEGRINRALIEMSRKHLKSQCSTIDRPIHKLARMVVLGKDPNTRFGFVSYKVELAQKFWGAIKRNFERNQLFQHLFPELIPDFKNPEMWNMSGGSVPRIWQPKEPTFHCFSKGTGFAFDDLTEDDLINEENYDSPTAVEKAVDQHKLAESLLDRREGGSGTIVTVENPWALIDVNSYIHKEEKGTAIFSVGCYGPRIEGYYGDSRRLSRGLPASVEAILRQLPQGEPIWPEGGFNRDELGRILSKVKPRIFTAHYLCDPADDEAKDFKLDWIRNKEFDVVCEDGEYFIAYSDDDEMVWFGDLNLYMEWDPALDGKSSESRNAILVNSIDYKGRICANIREFAKKMDPRAAMTVFLQYAQRYKPWLKGCGVEEVLFSKVLGDELKERAKAMGLWLPYKPLKVPKGHGKDQRIRQWVGNHFEDGKVYMRTGSHLLIEEYCNFGVPGMTRDLMDCLAHGTQLFKRPPSPTAKIKMQKEAERATYSQGVCGYGVTLPGAM